jgi:excisionase family DNA binding protein
MEKKPAKDACAELIADGFARVPEAAEFLGVSRAKIYAMMEAGELAYAKFGRSRRVPRRALKELAAAAVVAR